MRLFVAIQFSEEMRRSLCAIQDQLRRQEVRGNYTRPENLHLTLAFIGEYADADRALEVVESVSLTPFEIRLMGFGAFGDLWWAGLERSEPLESVARRLRRALASAEIPFDRKRFSPHITLVRRAVCGDRGTPKLELPASSMRVERVSLMRSDRGKDGMIYTEIE